MRRSGLALAALAAGVALFAVPAAAWHGKGHHSATTLAVQALPPEVPEFLRRGVATVAHCSLDPDLFTRPIGPEPLHSGESPEHFLDVELLKGAKPPASRHEFLQLCAERGVKPAKVGLLPYAVSEWALRLAVALAEHRRAPDNPHIQAKCLVYAGILAHYAEDLCQPLHTTVHWDGRANPDGSSPRSGIHAKVDALLGKVPPAAAPDARAIRPAALDDLLADVLAELGRSHALVETVYGLERDLPAGDAPLAADTPSARLAAERLVAAARFTASLYLTAWRQSEKVKLPEWYQRTDGPATQPAVRPDATRADTVGP